MSRPWFIDSPSATSRPSRRRTGFRHAPPHLPTPNTPINPPSRPYSRFRDHGSDGVPDRNFDKADAPHKLEEATEDYEKQQPPLKDSAAANGDAAVEATGQDIPPPVMSFAEMGFSAVALSDNIKRCKYVTPTPIQKHAIPVAMAGRDLMACAQTGSGKTAAFCFPIIDGIMADKQMNEKHSCDGGARELACPKALILAPTRELASQIHEEAKKFSRQTGVKVVVAYGGTPIVQQLRDLEKGADILVATPGRLTDMIERSKVSLRNVKYLALDEADRMLDMGFEPQIRKIVQQMEMPPSGERQTMLFSATFPTEIQTLASDFLSNYIFLAVGKIGSSTDLIMQRVEFVPDLDKRNHLVNLLHSQKTNVPSAKDALTLVFVETKKGADALERWLSRKGFPSTAIHGNKVQVERERALKSFKTGRTPILVATDVAARGLDIPHVAHVINFDLPKAVDDYVHRIGRTGRAGKSGLATAFFSEKNAPLAKALVELMEGANQAIPEWLREYATNSYNGSGYSQLTCYSGSKYGSHERGRASYEDCNNEDETDKDATYAVTPSYTSPDGDDRYAASASASAACTLPCVADCSSPTTDPFDSAPHSYGYSYGNVVATGWD